MPASSHPEFAPASAPGTAALVPRLPRTVVGLCSHLLRYHQIEQLLSQYGIECFEVLVDRQRLALLSCLHVREAKNKPGSRKLRVDPQRLALGIDGLRVLAGIVIGKAQVVPGIGISRVDP